MIRRAALTDIPWMLLEAEDFFKMIGSEKDYFNLIHLKNFFNTLVSGGIVLVEEKDGLRRGCIGGAIYPNLFNPEFSDLTELFWWVPEKYRKTRVGYLLFKEFMQIGKDNNVTNIVISTQAVSPINEDALVKRGFAFREKTFVMEN